MKKLFFLIITLNLTVLSELAYAEDLLQVYQHAKESNPTLRQAAAARDAAYSEIDRSRGVLLPQIGLAGSYGVTHGTRESSQQNSKSGQISAQINQELFDMNSWTKLNLAEQKATIQDIVYQAEEQALILNTAVAYFDVLSALDSLSFIEAQKKAIHRQLDQARQSFDVGLLPITDVQNVQAQYDQILANEVAEQNNLDNMLEELRQIGGQYYSQFNSLDNNKLVTERPANVDLLLKLAKQHNLDLFQARLNQELSREQIRLAQTGHLPTLSLNASTSLTRNEAYGNNQPLSGRVINGGNSASINLNVPIFSGGQTHASVKKAQFDFIGSSELLENTDRAVVKKLRSSHNNISAAMSTIRAYTQAVISAQSSLDATQAGYDLGTRTIVDVLNDTTSLYNAKQQLSTANYNYLTGQLKLKAAIGTLSETDLVLLNRKLDKAVLTSPKIQENSVIPSINQSTHNPSIYNQQSMATMHPIIINADESNYFPLTIETTASKEKTMSTQSEYLPLVFN